MFVRFAFVFLAAIATMSSAGAADLGADLSVGPAVDCNCGSNMITIYDVEPGVVTRHWQTDCECRYVPYAPRPQVLAGTAGYPAPERFVDPWRGW